MNKWYDKVIAMLRSAVLRRVMQIIFYQYDSFNDEMSADMFRFVEVKDTKMIASK